MTVTSAGLGGPEPPVIAEGLFSFQIGGSERVGLELAREFRTRGFRPVCFAFYDSSGPIRAELEAAHIPCVDLNYLRHQRFIRRVTYQHAFYQFLRRFNVSALHVHHATALTLCGAAARFAGIKSIVMTEHALHQLKANPSYRRQAVRDCRFATAISAVHEGIAQYFRDELHVRPERLHVIPNGTKIRIPLHADRLRLRQALGIEEQSFVFLFAGRLESVKDLPTLLMAFAILRESSTSQIRLLIAGEGSQRGALQSTAISLGIAHQVTFLGIRSDIRELMSAADIFVMSSITEGLPMVLVEAMATDLPCIATGVGGIPELLADGAGILVSPSSPKELADAMNDLMRSDSKRPIIKSNARTRVQRLYDLDQVVTQYLTLLGLPSHWPPR